MRKSAILTICVALVASVFAGGCATGAKGPSNEELISATMNNWKAGMETKDLAKIGLTVSEEFNHYEYGNKAQMLSAVDGMFKDGTLSGAKVSLETAETKIEGDAATVYPVEMSFASGSVTIEFNLKKEADGQWRAIGMTVEM
ncbi:MAG: hypothetical protein IT365_25620 [Candidatus Hydrogenedentes bacterium]|nr:hypothetical protein [Candidatus Hydrogenedentota bacterium]